MAVLGWSPRTFWRATPLEYTIAINTYVKINNPNTEDDQSSDPDPDFLNRVALEEARDRERRRRGNNSPRPTC
ncbi:MAG: hypothetical protein CMF31_05040 [Kordiimonas sp.]|nr:hypothetical protein [Kordiimonas sp.]